MGEGPGAAYRPLQGQKKEKLSILSLCLVLSWACAGSFFRLLLFLHLPPSPAQQSQKLNHHLLSVDCKKKCLGQKKKGSLRKQNVVGHRFDNIQGIFPSFERRLLWSQDTKQRAPAHWKCKCILGRQVRAHSFSLSLIPPPPPPPPPPPLSLCSLSFWSVYPWSVCERRGGWQVAVCKGIEAYEIFTKAIMTPWTEWVEEEGEERSGCGVGVGEKSKKGEVGEWRVPVFFFVRGKDEQRRKKRIWDFQILVVLWLKIKCHTIALKISK